jgi:hypothetical protein
MNIQIINVQELCEHLVTRENVGLNLKSSFGVGRIMIDKPIQKPVLLLLLQQRFVLCVVLSIALSVVLYLV